MTAGWVMAGETAGALANVKQKDRGRPCRRNKRRKHYKNFLEGGQIARDPLQFEKRDQPEQLVRKKRKNREG